MTDGAGARGGRGATLAAVGVLLAAVALRFHAFLLGGVFYFRDAGYFFVPWREAYRRLLLSGELPLWNDAVGTGRALAADPNAAAFWPLTPLVVLLGASGVQLLSIALSILLLFAALRVLGLGRLAATAGALVFLFSGVFQTQATLFTPVSSGATVPLSVALLATLPPDGRAARRRAALASFGLALAILGGEPVIAAAGFLAGAVVVAARALSEVRGGEGRLAARRLALGALALAFAVALAAVQVFPTAGELSRSARGTRLRPEDGALFWSVRPARVLTLLEPRLTGDPAAETPGDFWGAGTFDAGNPYYTDLAFGLVPLVLAAVGARDRRGRLALLLAAGAALLSFARFVPGLEAVLSRVTIVRYPEKWWCLATLAFATAAACGVERIATSRGTPEAPNAWTAVSRASAFLAAPLGLLVLAAALAPDALRAALWALGLGAGDTPAGRVADLLTPPAAAGLASLSVLALGARFVARGRAGALTLSLAALGLFLADAYRRVADSCPAAPPSVYVAPPAEARLVASAAGAGRFFDDAADHAGTVVRRARAASPPAHLDPLRSATGVVFGLRYALDNDVDRLVPAESTAIAIETQRLPWGPEKAAALVAAGVTVARVASPPPDPRGVVEVGRAGGDRIVRLLEARPEVAFMTSAWFTPDAHEAKALRTLPRDVRRVAVVERPGEGSEIRAMGDGRVEARERRSAYQRFAVAVGEPGGLLAVARTFDPNWKARVDGRAVVTWRADGHLTALAVPAGVHVVELSYENRLLAAGAAVSGASLLALVALFVAPVARHMIRTAERRVT